MSDIEPGVVLSPSTVAAMELLRAPLLELSKTVAVIGHHVEALETNLKPTPNPSQIRSSLIEGVEGALMESVKEQGSMARAAIRAVAKWLRDNPGPNSAWNAVARDLEQEADQ
jgi:hypothetical protein